MDIITAETLLWHDFDEAISDRHYTTLTTRCREADELAALLNRVLTQISDMPGVLLQWLVERSEGKTIREITYDPASGDTRIRLDYGDNTGGLLTCSPFAIRSESLWQGQAVASRASAFDDDQVITACGYDLQHLFNDHLDWLRTETTATQRFISERRLARAAL
ncbi:hypothetical protein [Cardiobacterium hominis]|uniref:hypothetical protein n=1 Tax=Cardiobacterium hominis TaxID=2718 RepID=UPI0006602872|nr:hypothetical protein [Cardiobacterium hominis]